MSLVSDDQKMMSAHKLVLSASSPYFKHILTTNKHSHPLLCLDGVSSAELQCVLDYIYQGEVQIYQEQLDRFLVVAQRLQLEGLTSQDEDQERKVNETSPYQENHFQKNFDDEQEGETTNETFELNNEKERKSESSKRRPRQSSSSSIAVAGSLTEGNLNNKEINEKTDEYLLRDKNGLYSCGVC